MWHLAIARRWTRARRARLLTGIAAASALIFLALAFLLRRAAGSQLDLAVTTSVQQLDHPALLAAMVAISALGYSPQNVLVAVATIVGFWLARLRREALFIVATAGAGLISSLAKILVERPRPAGEDIHVLSQLLDYSYPSGHVVGYVSFYGFLFFLTYVLFTRSPVRTAALTLLGALVGLVGLSRIYVGHHWASDVLGGYALGTTYLLILIQLYRVTRPGLEAPAAAPSSTDPLAAPSRN